MYRIVRVYPGDPMPVGRRETAEREARLRIYLAQECLGADGTYYKRPQAYVAEYAGYAEEQEYPMAEAEMVVLVWDPEPEVNEFGRVSA